MVASKKVMQNIQKKKEGKYSVLLKLFTFCTFNPNV
jgi:hypothetical protein